MGRMRPAKPWRRRKRCGRELFFFGSADAPTSAIVCGAKSASAKFAPPRPPCGHPSSSEEGKVHAGPSRRFISDLLLFNVPGAGVVIALLLDVPDTGVAIAVPLDVPDVLPLCSCGFRRALGKAALEDAFREAILHHLDG